MRSDGGNGPEATGRSAERIACERLLWFLGDEEQWIRAHEDVAAGRAFCGL
jgi:hypothetical protein